VQTPVLSAPSVIAAPLGSAAGIDQVSLIVLCVSDRVQVKAPSLSAPSVIAAPSGSAAGMPWVTLLVFFLLNCLNLKTAVPRYSELTLLCSTFV
jgi:hypothetical protein